MVKKLLAWSASRVALYIKCPYWFHEETVVKTVPFVETFEMQEGKRAHKFMEERVSKGTTLPPQYAFLEPIAKALVAATGQTYTEVQLALDENLKPCGYKDWDNCWVRGIADVLKIGKTTAWAGDYKNGKRKPDSYQLKLMAAMLFQCLPEVHTVTVAYIWFSSLLPLDKEVYRRENLDALWEELLAVPREIQESYVTDVWKKKPSRLCEWCPVNKANACDKAAFPYKEWSR